MKRTFAVVCAFLPVWVFLAALWYGRGTDFFLEFLKILLIVSVFVGLWVWGLTES